MVYGKNTIFNEINVYCKKKEVEMTSLLALPLGLEPRTL